MTNHDLLQHLIIMSYKFTTLEEMEDYLHKLLEEENALDTVKFDYKKAIEVIKSNYPPSNYTLLREALDLAIKLLDEKVNKK